MNQYTVSKIPVMQRPVLSHHQRSKESQIMKDIFKRCPICGKFSFKPNYNMNIIPDKDSLYAIIAMKGRRCRQCNFISDPTIKNDVGSRNTTVSL